MSVFDSALALAEYWAKGYVVCRFRNDQELTGINLSTNHKHSIFIVKGTVAIAVPTTDEPRWYLPTLTPPDQRVFGTQYTFAEIYEKEGLDVFELLLPYTERSEEDDDAQD